MNFIIAIEKELKLIDGNFNFNIHKPKHSSVYELRFVGKSAQYFCKWLFSDDDMYKSYKFLNYKKSLTETLQNSKNRELKKTKVMELITKHSSFSYIKQLAKEYDVAFQTIYLWKKEKYEKEGVEDENK